MIHLEILAQEQPYQWMQRKLTKFMLSFSYNSQWFWQKNIADILVSKCIPGTQTTGQGILDYCTFA